MDTLTMFGPRAVSRDTDVLSAYGPVAALGIVPINSFVVRAREPLLVDCGVVALGDAVFDAIRSRVALEDLRWIFLTHADGDHVGCLGRLLDAAPRASLVTSFLATAKLGLWDRAVDPARVVLVEPGQVIEAGDRRFVALAPPVFDAPETLAFFDTSSRFLFSADTFGALLSEPAETAHDVPADALRRGLTTWAHVDAPWIAHIDAKTFARALELYRRLAPRAVLSAHLPPAPGMIERLCDLLEQARGEAPSVAPDLDTVLARALSVPAAAPLHAPV